MLEESQVKPICRQNWYSVHIWTKSAVVEYGSSFAHTFSYIMQQCDPFWYPYNLYKRYILQLDLKGAFYNALQFADCESILLSSSHKDNINCDYPIKINFHFYFIYVDIFAGIFTWIVFVFCSVEFRRQHWVWLNWSYNLLNSTLCVLGSKLGFSRWATSEPSRDIVRKLLFLNNIMPHLYHGSISNSLDLFYLGKQFAHKHVVIG